MLSDSDEGVLCHLQRSERLDGSTLNEADWLTVTTAPCGALTSEGERERGWGEVSEGERETGKIGWVMSDEEEGRKGEMGNERGRSRKLPEAAVTLQTLRCDFFSGCSRVLNQTNRKWNSLFCSVNKCWTATGGDTLIYTLWALVCSLYLFYAIWKTNYKPFACSALECYGAHSWKCHYVQIGEIPRITFIQNVQNIWTFLLLHSGVRNQKTMI